MLSIDLLHGFFTRTCKKSVLWLIAGLLLSAGRAYGEQASLPDAVDLLELTPVSHPFSAADHQQRPLALKEYGYVEEEYLVRGNARVFDWPSGPEHAVLAQGPYTTRILVRRPQDDGDFSGITIVESFNPSSPVDLPIMWAESYLQFMADGHAWVGITIKPNTIKSLQRFDPRRYAALAMPHPPGGPTCSVTGINPWSQPTTPADETGLAWDMLSQIGALLKSATADNPLSRPAERLFMTGQSQSGGYSRTYAGFFGSQTTSADGAPLYDAYLYSGSPPWQAPIHQCADGFAAGDPRLITPAVGVPVIEIFTEGDIGTNIASRRPDADRPPDLFRRYEVPGASHVDPWEQRSFASEADMIRASGQPTAIARADCAPKNVEASDFPVRYVFNAAWRNLARWVNEGVPAPKAGRLELVYPGVVNPGLVKEDAPFSPAAAFRKDANGNAAGGVRTPYVDVPTARWVGAKEPADPAGSGFGCFFEGYKYSFSREQLRALYPSHADYVEKVTRSARALETQGWLTAADRAEIIAEAEAADVTFAHAQVSPAVREYRLHMFEPEVSVLANRTFELMFDTARVDAGEAPWRLPRDPRALDFSYEFDGAKLDGEGFAGRTFTDALLILKHGRIVHETYLNRATAETHFNSYSMGKTINSILAGIAIADGSLPSVDAPILDYMPELQGTAYDGLTLKNLLQMRTGVEWDDNFFAPGPGRDAHVGAFVDNEIRYVSAAGKILERAGQPGQGFNYNSIEAALVGEIVSRATGMSISAYLSERVWKPAGMARYGFYAIDGPPGVGKEFTVGAFNAVARDYARLGQMMLDGGMANGRRILTQEWVEESTTAGPGGAGDGLGYAYLWWTIAGTDAFTMLGGEGQFVYVDPSSATVIVKLSHIPVGTPEGTRAMDETFAFLAAASAWDPD